MTSTPPTDRANRRPAYRGIAIELQETKARAEVAEAEVERLERASAMTDQTPRAAVPREWARIEARQRANGCNEDNEPGDWGRPCCDLCICADEAA
jgi:hypothetical protein